MTKTATRFWEDFTTGESDEIGPYEITREDIVFFASRYDPQPFHLDEEAAKSSMIGRLCASGWHVMAILWKMTREAEENAASPASRRPAFTDRAEIEECRWRRPVFPGDRLTVKRTVVKRHPPREGENVGACLFLWEVFDQHGEKKTEIRISREISLRAGAS